MNCSRDGLARCLVYPTSFMTGWAGVLTVPGKACITRLFPFLSLSRRDHFVANAFCEVRFSHSALRGNFFVDCVGFRGKLVGVSGCNSRHHVITRAVRTYVLTVAEHKGSIFKRFHIEEQMLEEVLRCTLNGKVCLNLFIDCVGLFRLFLTSFGTILAMTSSFFRFELRNLPKVSVILSI
jgi:hypothetical protein